MVLAPKFNLELPDQTKVHINFEVDYLNTQFAEHTINNLQKKYSYLNLTLNPSIKFFDTDYSVELGAGLTYMMGKINGVRSEEHTSELQSRPHLVCRLLLEKKKKLDRLRTDK